MPTTLVSVNLTALDLTEKESLRYAYLLSTYNVQNWPPERTRRSAKPLSQY
jgi:hypothetical protein